MWGRRTRQMQTEAHTRSSEKDSRELQGRWKGERGGLEEEEECY